MDYFLKDNKNILTYALIMLILIPIFGFNFIVGLLSNILLLLFLIPLLKEIGINRITLPLVEEARLNSDEDVEKIKNYLYLCGENNSKLFINIESDSEIYYTQSL